MPLLKSAAESPLRWKTAQIKLYGQKLWIASYNCLSLTQTHPCPLHQQISKIGFSNPTQDCILEPVDKNGWKYFLETLFGTEISFNYKIEDQVFKKHQSEFLAFYREHESLEK